MDRLPSIVQDDLDLRVLWKEILRTRLRTGAIIGSFFLAAVAYAILSTEWYRAEVLLAPTSEANAQSLATQLGGLASLVGINVGESGSAEAVAVLGSRDLAKSFIEEQALVAVLLADEWDPDAEAWKATDPADWPDWRDAVDYFDEHVREVREDAKTGLVTLAVNWKDPVVAAEWANALVQRVNSQMRQQALEEALANISFLQAELASTGVISLQQSIGRLLETEMQKVMLAKGNEEFSFRVIDRAYTPREPSRPARALIVSVATLFGVLVAILSIVVGWGMREG